LIASCVQQEIPARLCVIDPAGGVELDALGDALDPEGRGLYTVAKYAGRPGEAKDLIRQTTSAMFQRLDSMKQRGVRQHTPTIAEPLNVLIVDELLLLPEQLKAGAAGELGKILSIGRKAAFTVWACTQKSQVETIGGIRDLFQQRICHAVKSRDLVGAALGSDAFEQGARCTSITRPGVGYMYVEGSSGYRRFRSVLVSDEQTRQLAKGIRPAALRARLDSGPTPAS
jgi:DNA segregation ATPase FtsK/SpoIIIE, S-DNA-T family